MKKEVSCHLPRRLSISAFAWGVGGGALGPHRASTRVQVPPWIHGVCLSRCARTAATSLSARQKQRLAISSGQRRGARKRVTGEPFWLRDACPNLPPGRRPRGGCRPRARAAGAQVCKPAGGAPRPQAACSPLPCPPSDAEPTAFFVFASHQTQVHRVPTVFPGPALSAWLRSVRQTGKHPLLYGAYVLGFLFY